HRRERAGARAVLHLHRERAVGVPTRAELVVAVAAPAVDGLVGQQRTGVVVAGRQRDHAAERADPVRVLHLHWRRAAVAARAVAELPIGVAAPADRGAVADARARVVGTGHDLCDVRQVADAADTLHRHRAQALVLGAVAVL